MPAKALVPSNGAVAFGSYLADFHSFQIEQTQSVEDVTPYGTNVCSVNVGNGTPDFNISIAAFALAHATNTPPGFGSTSTITNTGLSTTLTLDTGVTEAGALVVQRMQIQHGRMKASVPVNISGKNGGDWTETWPTS